jgi:hypothetical protein
MAAQTGPRNAPRLMSGVIPEVITLGVKAATKIYQGALVVNDAGHMAPGRTATGLIALGVAEDEVDNTGGANDAVKATARRGCFPFNNSAAGDAISNANIGAKCYIVDDQTVALTDNTGARSFAGLVEVVNSGGLGDGSNDGRVYVRVGTNQP